MRISVLPKTSLGRWSVGLAAAFILVGILVGLLAYLAGLELQSGSVGLMILAASMGVLGITAFVTGLLSIIKTKERSILVFVAVVGVGLFTLMFLIFFIGEEVLHY
jgi:hypothetical protein